MLEAKGSKIDELLIKHKYNGVVFISEKGNIIYEKAFGYANMEFKVPNTKNTKFGIASITKSMTAAAILTLVDDEVINLDTTVDTIIPDFPNGEKINIQKHRSMQCWWWSYKTVFLCEYYLRTKDAKVLPTINEYATKISMTH